MSLSPRRGCPPTGLPAGYPSWPSGLPGEVPGRLTQDVPLFFQLSDPSAQLGVLPLSRTRTLARDRRRPRLAGAITAPLVISAGPAPQRLAVDAQVITINAIVSPAETGTTRPHQP